MALTQADSTSTVLSAVREKQRLLRRDGLSALILLAPALLFLTLFVYLPAVLSLGLAFFHYHLFGVASTFAGVSNFVSALTYPVFWIALRNTLVYACLMVPLTLAGSLAIASLIHEQSRLYAAIRTVVLLPYITPVIATSIGWLWMFNPQYGLMNMFLGLFHLPASQWLLSPTWALPSVVLYSLWHGLGFDVIVMMGALASVPQSVVEAARVDGANRWHAFWRLTVPLVSPSLFFLAIVTTIGSLQVFSQIYALSAGQGGPEYATTTTMLLVYQTAFQYFHLSYGAAMAFFLVLLILALTAVQGIAARKWVFYQ